MPPPFPEKQDIHLINLVRDNPVLYDNNEEQYMDFNTREVIWQKIGDELKRPASECKARWVNIRDINRRILRKKLRHPQQRGNLYKYDKELTFMRPFYRDIMIQNAEFSELDDDNNTYPTICKVDVSPQADRFTEDSDNEKPDLDSMSTTSKWKKRRKKQSVSKDPDITEPSVSNLNDSIATDFDSADQIDSFLLSIGATLRTFSPYHLNLAKSKIFAIVQEHDLQQIVVRQQGQATTNDDESLPTTSSALKKLLTG